MSQSSQMSFSAELIPVRDVLPKAMEIVLAREDGSLTLNDRKVWNALLASIYRSGRPDGTAVYKARVSDLMGCLASGSSERLHESLARLAEAKVAVEYIDENGVTYSMRGHYLSYVMPRNVDGWVHYACDPVLIALVYTPKIFATLSMSCVAKFRSSHGLKLYEVLSLFINRQRPVWEVSLDEFREVMALSEGYERFDNLRRRVVEPAVAEVMELAMFVVDVAFVRAGRGGRVCGLRFTVRRPAGLADPRLSEADADVVAPSLSEAGRQSAISMLGERTDFEVLLLEWQENVRGLTMRSPDRSFLSWLDMRLARDDDASLGMLENATMTAMLDSWQSGR